MAKTKNKRYSKTKASPLKNKCPTVIADIEEDQDFEEDVLQRISNNLKSGRINSSRMTCILMGTKC